MTFASLAIGTRSVLPIRKAVLALVIATMGVLSIVNASSWSRDVQDVVGWIGLALIAICISGRTWCALYIGTRKAGALVTSGPYSISRNPLYVFSVIGAVGVGAQTGAVSIAFLAGLLAWIVHVATVRQEERRLLANFGEVYRTYLAEVPRFLPRVAHWRDADLVEVRPRSVVRNFFDACWFLTAVPVAGLIQHLQATGAIRVLLHLP